ncbi:porin [Hyphomicrobium methylovorum]|uniref:porin n=1 Tax=Hyphomicrobium methylovorum TaxID=84 RepID=UPI0015E772BB|nr:porin [Hyphomicrobium methylovorum]MBA2127824.1 porin [Hyphomicrobium methylovorum]
MMKYGLSAVVAAGLLAGGMTMSTSSASAADLGGNCCADLEERIAELEATTARKGNRKVSLTVSGWVGQQVTWWDDGGESNVYVHDLGTTLASHVKFTGQATIVPGWTAGYVLHLEAVGSDSLTMNQNTVDGPSVLTGAPNGVGTLQSFWFLKSDQLGKVSVGKQSQASDNTAILVDGSGSLVPANWVSFDVNSFFVRNSATGQLTDATWGGSGGCVWGDCNGLPTNSVRYDSPTFAGFSVSASWGEDDFWDVAARYAGEHHGFKVAIAGAFSHVSDFTGSPGSINVNVAQPAGSDYFQLGAYAEHVATGLFVYGAYGHLDLNLSGIDSNNTYYIKAGIRQRWNPLGHTVLYGEYERAENNNLAFANAGFSPTDDFVGTGKVDVWGLGVVQEIDAAAMSIWLKYRHLDASLVDDTRGTLPTDNFQYVGMGALINF